MRYLRATFKGYIGFYSGMGLEVVDIDFTKSTHNIILIIGINGCGKSTLINSLNIFPDPSSFFIKGKDASKHLVLFDQGNTYEIDILSAADEKGGRKTTKAFIRKNGLELNENGNVSSYKDIIFSEFELDSNFISLSSLSSTDRGLGDKTPAERKRFAANIIDNLEVYNDIYKNLNKKSLVYKSHINTLHTKIQNIGRKEDLESLLESQKQKEKLFNDRIVELNNRIVTIQAKTSLDSAELAEIDNANQKISELKSIIEGLESQIDVYENKTRIKSSDIVKKFEDDSKLMNQYTSTLESIKTEWREKYSNINSINDSLNTLKAENIGFDINNDIGDKYAKSNNILKKIEKELKGSVSTNPEDIIEITELVNLYNRLIVLIDDFYAELTPSDVELVVTKYSDQYRSSLNNEISKLSKKVEDKKIKISEIQAQMKLLAVLEERPSKCKIDSCPFISDAIKLKKSIKGDITDELSKIQSEFLQLSTNLSEMQEKLISYDMLMPKYMKLGTIRNMISQNQGLISKYNPSFLSSVEDKLSKTNPFNDIRDTQGLMNTINNLKIYKSESENNKILEIEYKNYQEKIQILNSNRAMEEKLLKEKDELSDSVEKLKKDIDNYQNLIDTLSNSISIEREYINELQKLGAPRAELARYEEIINSANKKSQKAIELSSEVNTYRDKINRLGQEIQPIVESINTISGQLTLLESYYAEFNEYKRSYDIIETIKKYCSPTGGGIQTLFMQLYMSKTLEISNNILSMLFGGEYQLLDFIINENEFRIPFVGSGLPVDDISSGSSSQISIMGMIINLVLLHQASTKFNIARLDEIDAGLDNRNRSDFINFIYQTINLLQIEQVFMISHSIEADNTNADIIKLKTYDNYEGGIQSGNIIYDYSENI